MQGITDLEVIRFKPEASFAVIAATGNFYLLRITGEELAYDLVTAESQEFTGDRQLADLTVVGAGVAGPVNYEPSYGEHDWLREAALATTVSNVVGTNGAGTGTATFTATGVNVSAGTPFAACESGQWIRTVNAVTGANNKLAQVVSVVGGGTGITVASGTYVAETGTTGVVFQGARFKNGQTLKTFTIERYNPDLGTTGLMEALRGNAVDQWSVDLAPGSILGGQYQFVGKDALAMSGASALPGTGVASLSNPVVNAVSNFSNLLVNGVAVTTTTFARKLQIQLKNNIRQKPGLGVLGAADLKLGPLDLEIPFEFYLADATYYNYFLQNTPVPVSFQITDTLGNAEVITFPRCKIMTARRPASGKGQDLVLSGTFQAMKDPITGKSIIIDRCGAAVAPWA